MNKKDKLYYDLINAYRNHSCNDTLIDTYIYKVLKIVKDYLDFDNLKKENQELIVNKNVAQAIALDQKREIQELKDQLSNDIILNETQIDDLTLEVANYKHALEEKNEIIMDLKEELESLHQAYNELNQTNEELIKINNQLGKEKEELNNEITLLKNKIEQLKNKKEGK